MLAGLMGHQTLGRKVDFVGPVIHTGPGHNLEQLCKLLEVPNKYGALADLEPDQTEAHGDSTKAARLELGDYTQTAGAAIKKKKMRCGDEYRVRFNCPSVERAISYIIECCNPNRMEEQYRLPAMAPQGKDASKRCEGCDRGASNDVNRWCNAGSN